MRPEKQLLLDEISEKVTTSKAMIITKYQKLSPNLSWNLSNLSTPQKCYFEVVKKRILKKALEKQGLKITLDQLQGHIGVFFINNDPMDGTKLLFKFKEENENVLEFVTGQFEDKTYSAEELTTLAKLPSKNEMRAQLLSIFEAPMAQTISIMQNVLTSTLHCMDNKVKKEESTQKE